MRKMFKSFIQDDSGATAIEYGLIAALIAVAIIVVVGNVGESLQGVFEEVSTELDGATGS